VEPPQVQNRLEPGGYGPGNSARPPAGGRLRGRLNRGWREGRTEGLRRRCGEAAGEKLGASPVDRNMVNVGTVPDLPFLPVGQAGGGQAHRRLMGPGRGGVLVVVAGVTTCQGGRESRSQGRYHHEGRLTGTPFNDKGQCLYQLPETPPLKRRGRPPKARVPHFSVSFGPPILRWFGWC
jgi:hypothetical protein